MCTLQAVQDGGRILQECSLLPVGDECQNPRQSHDCCQFDADQE